MRQISLRCERDRLLIAIAAAIILHVAIFVLVPFSGPAERDPLDPPLYVALDPLPPDEVEETPEPPQEEPEPELPEESEPEVEPEPEPEPEPEVEPEPESLQADDPAASSETEPPAEPPAEPAAETQPQAASDPEPAPPVDADPPAIAETQPEVASDPEPEPAPSGPAFVETPPPPPPPPRRRSTSDLRDAFGGDDRRTDSTFVDQQVSSLYDWQSEYSEELEAYHDRQQERSARTTAAEPGDDPSADQDTALSRQLSALIEGIRTSSSNVVNSDDPTQNTTGPSDQNSDDGSGITVEDGSGTRRRTRGAAVDLSEVSLGAGFPPEYPVRVRFQVDASGRVFDADVQPPTPDPDLNRAIETAVRQWRFQPAADRQSPPVGGSVTIIVQTR